MEQNRIREWFSIPNLMCYFRILLIPVFVMLYLRATTTWDYLMAAVVLAISALTDLFDGKVARHFNQVTELGKLLDPLADKLTQCAAVVCLCTRYVVLKWVVAVFLFKEILMLILAIISVRVGKRLDGAALCGKISTTVLDISLVLLLIMPGTDWGMEYILSGLCIGVLLYAMCNYILIYMHLWTGKTPAHHT